MMTKVKSGLFFFGLSLLMLWESLRLGIGSSTEPGPGFLPCCAGAILAVLSLSFIYRGRRFRKSQQPHSRLVVVALISVFIYSLVLNYLGFIIATFLLLAVLFHLGEPRPWWVLIAVSTSVTLLGYFFFGKVLHVFFPTGLLGF
jgi:putative tricarboxylic transport membrane protein